MHNLVLERFISSADNFTYNLNDLGFNADDIGGVDALDAEFLRSYASRGIQQQLGVI